MWSQRGKPDALSTFSKPEADDRQQRKYQLIYYSPTLFEQFGLSFELRLDMGGVLNVVQLMAVGITFFVLDRFGRRFWLLQGSCGMSVSHIIIAILVGERYFAVSKVTKNLPEIHHIDSEILLRLGRQRCSSLGVRSFHVCFHAILRDLVESHRLVFAIRSTHFLLSRQRCSSSYSSRVVI